MPAQITQGAPHPARQLALGPYVERIRAFCLAHSAQRDGSVQVRLGDRAVSLDPSEFALLVRSAGSAPEEPADTLPVEILGLLAKCVQDLAHLRASAEPTSRAVYVLQAELMLDSALGTVLLAETQRRVDSLIAQGGIDSARALTHLCHRLRHAVAEVGLRIADSERVRVGELVASLSGEPAEEPACGEAVVAAPVRQAAEERVLDVQPRKTRPRARRKAARIFELPGEGRTAPGLSSTSCLGLGLVIASAAWLYLVAFAGAGRTEFTSLTRGDFKGLDVLRRIEARPPSLYGQVDSAAWDGLDDGRRLALVEELSRILSAHHYSGALLETEGGRPVAQWLVSKGPSLIESLEK